MKRMDVTSERFDSLLLLKILVARLNAGVIVEQLRYSVNGMLYIYIPRWNCRIYYCRSVL